MHTPPAFFRKAATTETPPKLRRCQRVFAVFSGHLCDQVKQAVDAVNLADAKARLSELVTEQADSVLVCEHIGRTVIRRIEAEKLRHWLDKYRLGDLWRIGELGGNP